ncbi:LysE family transporter [Desulfobulbus sp.]|uniref:LysE family transporter n=1 Tax=Desulfobulbus sp. TaxID=895 RepID=UPI0027B87DA1|nr:LysE family transporter [Desulfobulbus sp.]
MTLTLLSIFASSFMIAFSGAMAPGPLMTVTISESTRRGAIAGPLMILGHGLLELLLAAALLSGFAAVLDRDDVFVAIALLGGTTLLWMGCSMLRGLSTLQPPGAAEARTGKNLVLAGIALSVCNPYWLIWWASIGLGYILHSARFGLLGVAAFFIGHILADLLWYSLLSFGVAKGRRLFSPVLYRRLIGGCAVFLLCFSGWFFYSGIEKMM